MGDNVPNINQFADSKGNVIFAWWHPIFNFARDLRNLYLYLDSRFISEQRITLLFIISGVLSIILPSNENLSIFRHQLWCVLSIFIWCDRFLNSKSRCPFNIPLFIYITKLDKTSLSIWDLEESVIYASIANASWKNTPALSGSELRFSVSACKLTEYKYCITRWLWCFTLNREESIRTFIRAQNNCQKE